VKFNELLPVYSSIVQNITEMESSFVHRDDNEFYKALGEVDLQLDIFRKLIEDNTGVSLL
jgi:phosphopentomutase